MDFVDVDLFGFFFRKNINLSKCFQNPCFQVSQKDLEMGTTMEFLKCNSGECSGRYGCLKELACGLPRVCAYMP